MPSIDVNYWAVLVAAAFNMALGAFWYSPNGFGKQWSKLTGVSNDDMKARGNTGMALSLAGALIMAFVLAHFVRYAGSVSFADGLVNGFWLWTAFIAVTMAGMYVFEGRSWKLWQINAGYYLVVLLVTGGLLAAWR